MEQFFSNIMFSPYSSIALAALFVFGLIIGSFLNVVILRYNTGLSVSKGRSACFSCGKTLRWHELVPLASYIFQKGSCRGCGSKISIQYPLVELFTGASFVLAFIEAKAIPILFVLYATLLALYIVIAAYDIRHKTIPDAFSYGAGLVSLSLILTQWSMTGETDYLRMIAGPAVFIFFWAFWYFSKGAWMGLGDGKLGLSIGWALGFSPAIAALLMSFWIGTIVSLGIIAWQRLFGRKPSLGLKSEIPFGPFLVIGFLIAFIWHADMQAILSHLAL